MLSTQGSGCLGLCTKSQKFSSLHAGHERTSTQDKAKLPLLEGWREIVVLNDPTYTSTAALDATKNVAITDFFTYSNGRTIRILGSAAMNFAWLACGRLDAWFEVDLNAWDNAAGALLVQEAGRFHGWLFDFHVFPTDPDTWVVDELIRHVLSIRQVAWWRIAPALPIPWALDPFVPPMVWSILSCHWAARCCTRQCKPTVCESLSSHWHKLAII